MVDGGSFQQTPQVDDSILVELQQKFGLNTRRDDQLDVVWEKAAEEESRSRRSCLSWEKYKETNGRTFV